MNLLNSISMTFIWAFSACTTLSGATGVAGQEGREFILIATVRGSLAVGAFGMAPDVVAVVGAITTGGTGATGGLIGPLLLSYW